MKYVEYYGSSIFLNESFQMTDEEELSLLEQILNSLQEKPNKTEIEEVLINLLYSLKDRSILKLKFVNRNEKSDISNAYGYYSSYENLIYLVLDKSNFDTKWFGLKTDYTKIVTSNFDHLIQTLLHELIHYTCSNYYQGFIQLWNDTFKSFLYYTFKNLVNFYFSDFVSIEVFKSMSPKTFIDNIDFKKTFDTYYNSLLINIKFRYKSFIKKYNDILSTLYSKYNFQYARFFDNVLINAIKLQNGDYSDTPLKLFNCIKKAYRDLEPSLNNINMHVLHYQEILDFSEIACVLSTYYKYSPTYSKLILKTLQLI